jgi:hypothetical protein
MFSLFNLGACSTTVHVNSDANSSFLLNKASQDVTTYGDLIYKGSVFKLDAKRTSPLYVYERRVRSEGPLQVSTSFTHDKQNAALIQMATHDAAYKLKDYTEYQFQLGEVGSVNITGTTAQFRLLSGESEKQAQETVSLPVVVGPTLYGFVFQNWEKLLSGDSVDFRFAVISRLETVGFILQKVISSDNLVRIRMKASSPFIALIVDPIYFTFSADRHLVSLEGRVPTKLKRGNSWVDLDAFVEYDNASSSFR